MGKVFHVSVITVGILCLIVAAMAYVIYAGIAFREGKELIGLGMLLAPLFVWVFAMVWISYDA